MPPAGPRSGDAIFASVERVVSFSNSSFFVVFYVSAVWFTGDFEKMLGKR